MKKRLIWIVMPVVVLGLGACKKKEAADAPKDPSVSAPVAGGDSAAPAPKAVVLTAAERAEFLGFSQYLPQETEIVMSLLNGSKTVKRVMSSELWKAMEIGPAAPTGDEMAELTGPAALFAQEFTIAFGNGTDEQTSHLLKLNRRSSYFQMRAVIRALAQASKPDGSFELYSLMGGLNKEILADLASDPESGTGLYEKLNMPPTYVAFRTTESNRPDAAQQIEETVQMLAMLKEMAEPIEVTVNDSIFTGYKILGAKVSELMKTERDTMVQDLPAEVVDQFIEATSKKNLVVLSGVLDEYVVMFVGSSEEDFKLAESAETSLLGSDGFAFCDSYASKELGAVIYGQDGAVKEMLTEARGSMADMAAGARDGLVGSDELGDTRDLEALLRMVEDREAALYSLYTATGGGTVLFFDEGLRIESYGGYDNGLVEWDASNKMASLGDGEDVVMFANLTTNAIYDARLRGYLEAMMETAYVATMKFSELPDPQGQFIELKNYAKMFDAKFRPDLLTFWEGFSGGFSGSIGTERAWVMDLKGSMPTIPGIPQAIVDEGRFPRLSMLAPVVDRSKLGDSWGKMNTGLTGMLANVSEMLGSDIPMQKPISSEKDGFTTWFFGMPFFNDDFMPSVTVGDEWFTASTSKNQALDLLKAAQAGGETKKGAYFTFDLKAMDAYAEETLAMLEKHKDDVDLSESDIEDLTMIGKALDDLDKLTVYVRREDGELRSSVHLKTR